MGNCKKHFSACLRLTKLSVKREKWENNDGNLSYDRLFNISVRTNMQYTLYLYSWAYAVLIMSVDTSIRHTWRVHKDTHGGYTRTHMGGTQGHTWGVHISNPLLLLLQLIDFNETFMEIFFTQCGGPPSIFSTGFFGVSHNMK